MNSLVLGKSQKYYFLHSNDRNRDSIHLLFVQDGEDYLELGDLQACYERLLEEQPAAAQSLVMVLIPPGSSLERYESYHPKGSHHRKFLEFFLKELVPEVEKHFTDQDIQIRNRGLLGDSLGGAVSLSIVCRQPNRWTHLLLQSAALSEIHHQEAAKLGDLKNLSVYQLVGKKEDEFVSPISNQKLFILSHNRRMKELLETQQADVTYIEEDEEHVWVFWQRDLPRAISYFLSH
ncbi:enterochelin esterase-like enzyme [Cytobacillus oceanisediminis]|uniref:Enterochelin esterase-like enzyme n=1 Tax=Cytobacillus oceanisediminis TaxID=665099 RepID=A0A2V3A3C3_9BACI|nr:alpha/beta hydrolase-fold protein [Cytobacillus oceanisediminis]PWW31306.1 enterochelin esterase-like enzyme [Cytobacillus oceanisediminis]